MCRLPLLAVVVLLGACGSLTKTGLSAEPAGQSHQYANSADGLVVEYPGGWHRSTAPSARAATASVELVALSTVEPQPAVLACSPLPWATMQALGEKDVVLTVRTPHDGHLLTTFAPRERLDDVRHGLLDREPSPNEAAPGGCLVEGVKQWHLIVTEHGRDYELFVAARSPTEAEKEAVDAVLQSLRLDPIVSPAGDAEVGKSYWHVLYTHCGITRTHFNGADWIPDPPAAKVAGGPPAGWSNPVEAGYMKLVTPTRARFESRDAARAVEFRLAKADDPEPSGCR